MISDGVIYKRIHLDKSDVSVRETALRLGVPRDFDCAFLKELEDELFSVVDVRGVALRTPVTVTGSVVDMLFLKTESRDLSKVLTDVSEAYVFAVTLGMGAERLLLRYSKISESAHFILDALASSLAEAAADKMEKVLLGGLSKKRFSPGYGDLCLDIQRDILSALSADRLLGISLTDGLLMKPEKSITAIVGIRNE